MANKIICFNNYINLLQTQTTWDAIALEAQFKALATTQNIKVGELMMPLRIMLVGAKFGPGVFDIAAIIGKDEVVKRIENVLHLL